MRLLEMKSPGEFSLIQVASHDIHPYAILSHTWTSEEVTYQELINGTGKSKLGYEKIKFCGEQAIRDGLQYFWVDTCCIDKTDRDELSKAINSMFRWYLNAKKCYVYLTDVSTPHENANVQASQSSWEAAFRNSRWFTRGWTLQELIAPTIVEFFSQEGKLIGDKKSLEKPIAETTKIPVQAVRGNPFSEFSIAERKKWAAHRQTTEEEDLVYCLMGLCEVSMPTIYGEGKEAALKRLEMTVKGFSQYESEPKNIKENPAPFIVPFERNPNFTGRATQLAAVESKLFVGVRTSKVAITGLGGIGKTQLVLELVYRNRDKYKNCSVIWILASNMESLQQGYLDVARQLNIPGSDNLNADAKKLVQDYLSNEITGRWLLVFDNADDVNMWITKSGPASSRLIDYLPRSEQGCIVFTTRDRKAAVKLASQNVVEVPEMDEEVAVQLLQKCLINPELVDNKPDTATLLKELTYLPLAIVQAAAYINENDIVFADYLSLLADQEEVVIDLLSEEFEDDGRYASMKNPVATTWLISFEQIRQRDTLAAEYLTFMACIDPKDIPKSILPEGASRKKELDAIGTLTAYSFVIKRSDLAFDLHRLVHLATRNWLQQNHLISQCTEKAIVRLEEVFPNSNHQNRAKWRTYFPHARYILNSNLLEKDLESRINLLWRYGTCLKEDGRWNDAEAAIVEVLAAEERKFGTEHRSTLISMDSLASILWNLGRPKEAEDLGVKVLEKSKRVLGPEHPLTLATLSNLATTYMKQGRFKEAGELNVQVLETKKKVLGPENPETLTVMGNLASTYSNQGRWKEAEELQLEVLEKQKRVLGQEDPSTLATMSNLATTYAQQGCWKEAEDLEVQLFESKKRVLGEEHPYTLISMSNLASFYYAQGRWKESEELHLQVMEKKKKTLGLDFPDTIDTMHDLASVYRIQRRWAEAEELGLQVVASSKRVLGIEHPDTIRAMDMMAILYSDQKRWREAEDLGVEVLALSRKVCGEDHPSTLTRMANLAMVYSNSGRRLNTGEEMEREVMEKKKNKLGAEHPSTLSTMHNLACTWKLQGRDREASQLMEECATLQARVIGENHPETLASRGAVLLWRDDF